MNEFMSRSRPLLGVGGGGWEGGGGGQIFFQPLLGWGDGGHKIKCQIFWGIGVIASCIFVKCHWLL